MPETAPAPPTDYPFGFVLWNTNQRIDSAELTNVGEIGLRAMTALLSRLLADEPSTYQSGFFGADCLVSVDSGLTMDVAAGMGFYNYNAYDNDDFDHVVYRPIAFAGDQVTLDAHDPTNPRIDVISIAPAYEDMAQESRQIWDAGTESFGPQNVYTRRIVSYTLTVTKGTPAGSPVAPATPSGHVKLAECAVPATAGAVTVTDSRTVLTLAQSLLHNDDAPVYGDVTEGSESNDGDGDFITVTIDTKLWDDGAVVAGIQPYVLEGFDEYMAPRSVGRWVVTTGTLTSTAGSTGNAVVLSDVNGQIVAKFYPHFSNTYSGGIFIRATPTQAEGVGRHGHPTITAMSLA